MKINKKSLPVYVDEKELKQKLIEENKTYENWQHSIKIGESVLMMELNLSNFKWECKSVSMNGYIIK